MKNYKKINTLLLIAWIIIFGIVITVLFLPTKENNNAKNNNSSISAEDESTTIDVEDTTCYIDTITPQLSDDVDLDETSQTTEPMDISNIKEYYWYLFDDNDKTCYVFKFGENNRVDLAYIDSNSNGEFATGYSVFFQSGDKITMKHLPNVIPIKNFEFTVKDNKLYKDDTQLEPQKELSSNVYLNHFS